MGARENKCQILQECENTGKILKFSCVRMSFCEI